jgi:transcriptional repressor NrdR
MRCPYCAGEEDRVVDSRPADDGRAVRRRRECARCGQRYSTSERVELAPLLVRKRSGSLQPFDPARIAAGMRKATANLDIPPEEVTTAAARVEARIRGTAVGEVGSDVIGGHVLESLKVLHPVAYMRFASVHKSFTSPEDFARELRSLGD